MIKQEVQANEQKKKNNTNNNNNKRERKIFGEGYQPLVVTPKVTSPELSVPVQYKLHKMEEWSDI